MVEKSKQNFEFEEEKKSRKSIDKNSENDKIIETQKTKLFFSSVLSSLKSFFESEKQIEREYNQEVKEFAENTNQKLKKLRWDFSINQKGYSYDSLKDRDPDVQSLILENAYAVNNFINKAKADTNLIAKFMSSIADRILKS